MNGHEEKATLVGRVRRSDDGGVPVENVIVRPRPGAAGRRGILLEILLRVENTRIVVVSRFARFRPGGDGRGEVREAFPRCLQTRHAARNAARLAIAFVSLDARTPRKTTAACDAGAIEASAEAHGAHTHLELLGDAFRSHRVRTSVARARACVCTLSRRLFLPTKNRK